MYQIGLTRRQREFYGVSEGQTVAVEYGRDVLGAPYRLVAVVGRCPYAPETPGFRSQNASNLLVLVGSGSPNPALDRCSIRDGCGARLLVGLADRGSRDANGVQIVAVSESLVHDAVLAGRENGFDLASWSENAEQVVRARAAQARRERERLEASDRFEAERGSRPWYSGEDDGDPGWYARRGGR